jgi:hypothetical protein
MIMGQAAFKAIVNKGGDHTLKMSDTQAREPTRKQLEQTGFNFN